MTSQLNQIPLLRLLIPFITGIITALYLTPNLVALLSSFGVATTSLITLLNIKSLNKNFQKRWIYGIIIYGALFLGGASLTTLKHKGFTSPSQRNKTVFTGKIIAPTQLKSKSVKVIAKLLSYKSNEEWHYSREKVLLYVKKDNRSKALNVGDLICFKAGIKSVSPPKNPYEFNFKRYLSYHLIHQQSYLDALDWQLLKKSSSTNFYRFASDCRKELIKIFQNLGIGREELPVASALILGYKDNIDNQLKNAYSSAGAMHVLAVSGLHVGVIYLVFNQLFSFFEKIKYGVFIKGLLLILMLWCYATLTGLSPSVMRASTMFSFIIVSKMTSRISNLFNTLSASALVLLIYNPLLIMEVGFQLSYLAVVGIVIIQPWINNWFSFSYWLPRKIWEITAVSIAAQIATFPLSLLYFHQFPNYFMLSNLIVIPLAIVILYLGILTLICSSVPVLNDLLGLGLHHIIKTLNSSVSLIQSLPYALTENIRFTITDTWLFYLFIASTICLITYRRFKYLLFCCGLLAIFLIGQLYLNYSSLEQRRIIIYNIPKFSVINFLDHKHNILLTDKALLQKKDQLMFHVQNNWIDFGAPSEELIDIAAIKTNRISSSTLFTRKNYFQFYETKIAIIDDNFKPPKSDRKLNIDLLIISKNLKVSIQEILKTFNTNQIILDASVSKYHSKRLSEEAKTLNIKCWSVLLDGAFVKNI